MALGAAIVLATSRAAVTCFRADYVSPGGYPEVGLLGDLIGRLELVRPDHPLHAWWGVGVQAVLVNKIKPCQHNRERDNEHCGLWVCGVGTHFYYTGQHMVSQSVDAVTRLIHHCDDGGEQFFFSITKTKRGSTQTQLTWPTGRLVGGWLNE